MGGLAANTSLQRQMITWRQAGGQNEWPLWIPLVRGLRSSGRNLYYLSVAEASCFLIFDFDLRQRNSDLLFPYWNSLGSTMLHTFLSISIADSSLWHVEFNSFKFSSDSHTLCCPIQVKTFRVLKLPLSEEEENNLWMETLADFQEINVQVRLQCCIIWMFWNCKQFQSLQPSGFWFWNGTLWVHIT